MTMNIKTMVFLFAFVMQSMTVWSSVLGVSPVCLHYKQTTVLDGFPKPSKIPVHYNIPLSVFLDEDTKRLMFTDSSDKNYGYSIYDESSDLVLQGILDFVSNDIYLDLSFLPSGVYSIDITDNDCTYAGTFILH